jgi:hypothetical protein
LTPMQHTRQAPRNKIGEWGPIIKAANISIKE